MTDDTSTGHAGGMIASGNGYLTDSPSSDRPSSDRPSSDRPSSDRPRDGDASTEDSSDDASSDDASSSESGEEASIEHPRFTQSEVLIQFARSRGQAFTTPAGEPFMTCEVDGQQETMAVRSARFRRWLHSWFYSRYEKAPYNQALEEALRTLEAIAEFDGPVRPVHLRVAGNLRRGGSSGSFSSGSRMRDRGRNGSSGSGSTGNGSSGNGWARRRSIYIDLCNEDMEIVEITEQGWRIIQPGDETPRFRRTAGMAALPRPKRGGSLEALATFVRVRDNGELALLLAYLVQSLCPVGPYPILTFTGEQGAGKSTASRIIRALIDPSPVPLRSCPTSESDLVIAANNGWNLAFDNMDALSDRMSNAFCRLATGGGFGTRKLYTAGAEQVFAAQRPALLNGITDLATRPDLRDRMLQVELDAIPRGQRLTEAELWRTFDEARPYLFGGLCTALSTALCRIDAVSMDELPRMADFALWAVAAEPAFPVRKGTFLRAYRNQQQSSVRSVVDRNAVAVALCELLAEQGSWTGTVKELLIALKASLPDPARPPSDFPGSYQAMGAELRRLMPVLRDVGIERRDDPRARSRSFTLYWADDEARDAATS